jgi:hypothetical protein
MAWMNNKKTSFGSQGGLMKAFEGQTQSIGRMPGPAMKLHPLTMKPQATMPLGQAKPNTSAGSGPNAGMIGSAGRQSPAQHAAVEKAAMASASKRKKGLL